MSYHGKDDVLFVDVNGKPLVHGSTSGDGVRFSATAFSRLLESSVVIAIVTATMYYVGSLYYQSYFASFGPHFVFPSLGSTDYITKALDLMSSPFILILTFVWIVSFVLVLEEDERIAQAQELRNLLTERNREIGGLVWQLFKYRRKERLLLSRIKQETPDEYQAELKIYRSSGKDYKRFWPKIAFLVFPYHLGWRTTLSGFLYNTYLLVSIALFIVTASRLNALSFGLWLILAIILSQILIVCIFGKSVYHVVRRQMKTSLTSRMYWSMYFFVLLVGATTLLVGALGRHDAQRFLETETAHAYLARVDLRSGHPDLEAGVFRVVLHREGNYYLIGADESTAQLGELIIVPESEVIVLRTISPDSET